MRLGCSIFEIVYFIWCLELCIKKDTHNPVVIEAWGLFYQNDLTLILARLSNHMLGKVWDEITYPFLNLNGCTIEV